MSNLISVITNSIGSGTLASLVDDLLFPTDDAASNTSVSNDIFQTMMDEMKISSKKQLQLYWKRENMEQKIEMDITRWENAIQAMSKAGTNQIKGMKDLVARAHLLPDL